MLLIVRMISVNVKDHNESKIYINSKVVVLKIDKFSAKGWSVNGLDYLLKKLRDSGTTARQPGSGRRQSARTAEDDDSLQSSSSSMQSSQSGANCRNNITDHPTFFHIW